MADNYEVLETKVIVRDKVTSFPLENDIYANDEHGAGNSQIRDPKNYNEAALKKEYTTLSSKYKTYLETLTPEEIDHLRDITGAGDKAVLHKFLAKHEMAFRTKNPLGVVDFKYEGKTYTIKTHKEPYHTNARSMIYDSNGKAVGQRQFYEFLQETGGYGMNELYTKQGKPVNWSTSKYVSNVLDTGGGYSTTGTGFFYKQKVIHNGKEYTGFGISSKLDQRFKNYQKDRLEHGYESTINQAWMGDAKKIKAAEAEIKKRTLKMKKANLPGFKTESMPWEENQIVDEVMKEYGFTKINPKDYGAMSLPKSVVINHNLPPLVKPKGMIEEAITKTNSMTNTDSMSGDKVIYLNDVMAHERNEIASELSDKYWMDEIDKSKIVKTKLKVKDLIPSQPNVYPDVVLEKIRKGGQGKVTVIKHGNKYYVIDGHNTLTSRIMLGNTDTMVDIITLDNDYEDLVKRSKSGIVKPKGLSADRTLQDNIKYVVQNTKEPKTTAEIAKELKQYYPDKSLEGLRRQVTIRLSEDKADWATIERIKGVKHVSDNPKYREDVRLGKIIEQSGGYNVSKTGYFYKQQIKTDTGNVVGYGISNVPKSRLSQHRRNLSQAGMEHSVTKMWKGKGSDIAAAERKIKQYLSTNSQMRIDVEGFKTESANWSKYEKYVDRVLNEYDLEKVNPYDYGAKYEYGSSSKLSYDLRRKIDRARRLKMVRRGRRMKDLGLGLYDPDVYK